MNDKVKSLFFSQYLGQKVFMWDNRGPLTLSDKQIWERTYSDRSSLLLRDISQLTDEEAINVAKLSGFNFEDDTERAISYDTTLGEKNAKDYYINRGKSQLRLFIHKLNHRAYQYLNSLGYLLPFTYLSETNQPITLTPAEIINLGWAKIKSNEQ